MPHPLGLPLCTLNGKLQTFPTVKSKTIGFFLNWTQQYISVLFHASCFLKKSWLFWVSWHVLHYTIHMTPRVSLCFEIAGSAWQNDVLQICVSRHSLVERGKDKAEYVSRASSFSGLLVPWQAKVHNCIPRSPTVYIATTCLRCDNTCPKDNLGSACKSP